MSRRVQWPKKRGEQFLVVGLSLALIPLILIGIEGAKEICHEGDIMWEGQAKAITEVDFLLRVRCDPKDGPFQAQYARLLAFEAPPGSVEWETLSRHPHVEPAREALERFLQGL